MRLFGILVSLVIVLMVGFWLMYSGFRGMLLSSSSLGLDILSFLAGVVCLIAGLIMGVYLLRPEQEA